jgi:hypothetical protein
MTMIWISPASKPKFADFSSKTVVEIRYPHHHHPLH